MAVSVQANPMESSLPRPAWRHWQSTTWCGGYRRIDLVPNT